METIITFILCIAVSIIVAVILNKTTYFNSNVDSSIGLDLPEFKVVEIKEAYSTEFKPIAEYTVVNCFFKRKNARGWIYRKYKFYDESGRYKIGDKLTLR